MLANRSNGMRSGGPKTPMGKAVSRMNAVKHGLLAKQVLVMSFKLRESASEFKEFCAEFYADLAPVGAREEMLVEELIGAVWRLCRARVAESGEIALSVDEDAKNASERDPVLQCIAWGVAVNPVSSMEESAMGNRMLAMHLRDIRESVESEGELSEAAIEQMKIGDKPNPIMSQLKKFRAAFLENPQGLKAPALRLKHKEEVLAYIDTQSEKIWQREEECEEKETIGQEAREAAAVLPSQQTLEKIMRYEGALLRQRDRAMNQLERLQRRRQGDHVPPPMTMDISSK